MPKFQRRHYEAMAALFKKVANKRSDPSWQAQCATICVMLCAAFEADNPNFDAHRFIEACKPDWGDSPGAADDFDGEAVPTLLV